ncbi:MAG: hypothetical protein LC799_08785 [Actinobacteria bacterium]|nr:hypothetical protein [Actinomycetota bacterium]
MRPGGWPAIEVYGTDPALRTDLEARESGYVLGGLASRSWARGSSV